MQRHSLITLAVFAAMIVAALFVALPALADGVPYKLPVKRATVDSAAKLADYFADADYTVKGINQAGGVPRIFVRHLPEGIDALPAADKEGLFIRVLLPMIAKGNHIILQQRERLLGILRQRAAGWLPTGNDRYWLSQIAQAYQTSPDNFHALLRRVDVVPASLALAQGIEASAWGTAGPARTQNNLFATHARDGVTGDAGFPTLMRGVLAYMYKINVAARYREARYIRAEAREDGDFPTGDAMAAGLATDPEDATKYGEALRNIISTRNLAAYDRIKLMPYGKTVLVAPSTSPKSRNRALSATTPWT
ncbi:MAG: glucosaminidase domain-containing protein [Alphaproteobacteria bacterium]|nr:glucosaminidase domain-containing protein [Alphaproteobacteria bacterium]